MSFRDHRAETRTLLGAQLGHGVFVGHLLAVRVQGLQRAQRHDVRAEQMRCGSVLFGSDLEQQRARVAQLRAEAERFRQITVADVARTDPTG